MASQHYSSQTLVERVFKNYGIKPVDIPAGLVVFNGLLWVEWLSVFAVAVRRRPLRYLKVHSIKFQEFHCRLRSWKIYSRMERYTMSSANKISSYKWFQRMGRKIGVSSTDLTYGTIETIIIYNALLPICWAPINFACSILFIQCYRSYFSHDGRRGNGGGGIDGTDNGSDNNTNHKNNGNGSESATSRCDSKEIVIDPIFRNANNQWMEIQPLMHLSENHAEERHRINAVVDCLRNMNKLNISCGVYIL